MNNQLAVQQQTFSLVPKTLSEAMQFAEMVATSSFVPAQMKGKPGDVMIAIQYGLELGLSPLQGIQNVAIINGRSCVWGDAMLALCLARPDFEDIQETMSDLTNDKQTAHCTVMRKGRSPVTKTFSIEDAKKAKLWGKDGTWSQYPGRMLQMRARGFALRDAYADALKGIIAREEAQDIPTHVEAVVVPDTTQDTPFGQGGQNLASGEATIGFEAILDGVPVDAIPHVNNYRNKHKVGLDEQEALALDEQCDNAIEAIKVTLKNKKDDPAPVGDELVALKAKAFATINAKKMKPAQIKNDCIAISGDESVDNPNKMCMEHLNDFINLLNGK